MTQVSVTGGHGPATPWLRRLAAAMLDCALLPALDAARAQSLLASVSVLGESFELPISWPQAGDFPLRATLLATAATLLGRPDAAAEGSYWRRAAQAWALADDWLDLPAAGRSTANSDRIRHALSLQAAAAPDRLAADMRRYRDAPLDQLADAHFMVRLLAGAWRLAGEGEASVAEVSALLDQREPEFASRIQRSTAWNPPPDTSRSESDLQASIDRFQSLQTVLLPMADAENPASALAALEVLLPPWLGRAVLPLGVDADGGLTVHGHSDLAGQRLRVQGGRSLAARALERGEPTRQAVDAAGAATAQADAEVAVFDRQVAERLGATALVAYPIGAGEPVAVLLTNADADGKDLNLVAIHAGRWLKRLQAFDRQLQGAAAEQQLRFTRRVREAVHEISNPLSVIQNYLHLLGTRIAEGDPAQEQVRLISEELRRAGSLLRTLTDAQAGQATSVEAQAPADVNAVLSEVLALAELSLDPGVAIDVRFTPGKDLPALADSGQRLHQVLLNLIKNALEAMPAGGVLDVAVDRAVNDRGRRGVEIRIADTGAGIDPELLDRIFESGVSIKGEGRGLGLAITSRLVKELGGQISCRSRVGTGTTFVLWLPAG